MKKSEQAAFHFSTGWRARALVYDFRFPCLQDRNIILCRSKKEQEREASVSQVGRAVVHCGRGRMLWCC